MSEINWHDYDHRLTQRGLTNENKTTCNAIKSFEELTRNNPAYQPDAKVNGMPQGMIVIKGEHNTCKLYVHPCGCVEVGDYVDAYDEIWLVIDVKTDEYGLHVATAWMCNNTIKFQNYNSNIVVRDCVIDDGSYSTMTQHPITTPNAQYTMYLSLDDETEKIFIDKRLSVGSMYNKFGEQVLQVMNVIWIDKFDGNYGMMSHLLKLRLTVGAYNAETDSIEQRICDYISPPEDLPEEDEEVVPEEPNEGETKPILLVINGKDSIRIGMKRTYTCSAVDNTGNVIDECPEIAWGINDEKISINASSDGCVVQIPLNDDLVGNNIILSAATTDGQVSSNKIIEVVSIG